jgi:KDO2-lipid IV(A) lauroyltransferase
MASAVAARRLLVYAQALSPAVASCGALFMAFLFRALSLLPLASLYRVFGVVGWLTFRVFRWREALARSNLARAFPERTIAERDAILAQSYRNLADLLAEIVWSFRASPEELVARCPVTNPELIGEHLRAGRSVLLLTAHFCNWEWQILAGNLMAGAPVNPIYKPQPLAGMDRFLRATRSRFGGEPIPHKKLMREILRRRREPRVYAMVADQTPTLDEPKHWTRFLNEDSAFFVGPDVVARAAAAAVVFVDVERVGRGRYRMHLVPLAEPPYRKGADTGLVERYARALEIEIRRSPADWLWVHRKWKYDRPRDPAAPADGGA